jgi:hypothetical protein
VSGNSLVGEEMRRWGVVILLICSGVWAEDIVAYPPLFATVLDVAENDRLNVRADADYRSAKVASLPNGGHVGVNRCIQKRASTWCRIHHLAQYDYEGYGWDAPKGWVNAKYLHFNNRGYVLIDGKGHCDYVLGCQEGKCDIVVDYTQDKDYHILSVRTQKIDRSRLYAESHFGAMNPEGDGYCTDGRRIEEYLKRSRIEALKGYSDDAAYQRALKFLNFFSSYYSEPWYAYIHPTEGVRIGYETRFGSYDRYVTPETLERMEDQYPKRYLWGYKANEEKVEMSLFELIRQMPIDLTRLKEVKALPDLRGFPCPKHKECRGYLFYSYGKAREVDLSWEGLVVIMERSEGKWYVAGILHDRWTI